MVWPPTEKELLKAHAPGRGVPIFSPELCEPLVEKGLLRRIEDELSSDCGTIPVRCTRYELTGKGVAAIMT